jgi:hypothetical protein
MIELVQTEKGQKLEDESESVIQRIQKRKKLKRLNNFLVSEDECDNEGGDVVEQISKNYY